MTEDCLAPAGVSLIPTQLFSAAGDFIFAIILFILQRTLYKKKKKTSGIVTAVYLMLYAVGRFLIEFLRNDPRGAVGVLSTSQFIAIFMFVAAYRKCADNAYCNHKAISINVKRPYGK